MAGVRKGRKRGFVAEGREVRGEGGVPCRPSWGGGGGGGGTLPSSPPPPPPPKKKIPSPSLPCRGRACFSNRKKNRIKILITKARVLADKPVHCGLLTDSFIVLSAKLFQTSILNVINISFPRLVIIGTFEKWVPGLGFSNVG